MKSMQGMAGFEVLSVFSLNHTLLKDLKIKSVI